MPKNFEISVFPDDAVREVRAGIGANI